jgi:succinyldiaminopimelate transaminase
MHRNPVIDRLGEAPLTLIHDTMRAMRAAGEHLVDFSIGDPREPTPSFIPEALKAAVPAVSQYPTTRGLPQLRDAIAGYVKRRFGVEVDPVTQVLPTAGSKEAIFTTPLAFVDRAAGDIVIWGSPGYPTYQRGALFAGATPHEVVLGGDFVFRPELVAKSVWDRAALAWICSPHNPAGSVMDGQTVSAFVDTCRSSGTLLCADECYVDLYDQEPPISVLEVAGPGSVGVLSYLSLSKRSGMTGYRSGAIVGDAGAIAALFALRTSTGTAPPEFTQAAAIAAWSDDAHASERRAVFGRKRQILRAGFERLGLAVVASQAGLYLWVAVGDDVDVTARLLRAGVVVSPGRVFGPGGEGYIRLALVPTVDECDEAVEAVVRCLG